jgi:hypothetical protein
MANVLRVVCVAVFLGGTPLFAEPASDLSADAEPADGARVRLHGRVRLVGNMPFPEFVITGADEVDWYVHGEDRKKIEAFNGQLVVVTGTARVRRMYLADGAFAGLRRRLENITVTRQ